MAREKQPPDAARIDALYGLEPVFEPGQGAPAQDWLELQCAFCGEPIGTSVDLSAGSVSYIEDCQVCCQPLLIHLECDDAGQLLRGWAERGD
jgi:hypothetical protein